MTERDDTLPISVREAALERETVIADQVSYEDWLSGRFGRHTEWVYGAVIQMSPIQERHDGLSRFLMSLFDTYCDLTGGGRVLQDPMVMRPTPTSPGRQPDIQVLLPNRLHLLRPTQVVGPANLVVEIVSDDSQERDRGVKFVEYEKGGVDEYWILDPLRQEPLFFVRGEDGLYRLRQPVEGIYTSVVLPRLRLEVALLWREKLPSVRETVHLVEQMLGMR